MKENAESTSDLTCIKGRTALRFSKIRVTGWSINHFMVGYIALIYPILIP